MAGQGGAFSDGAWPVMDFRDKSIELSPLLSCPYITPVLSQAC